MCFIELERSAEAKAVASLKARVPMEGPPAEKEDE